MPTRSACDPAVTCCASMGIPSTLLLRWHFRSICVPVGAIRILILEPRRVGSPRASHRVQRTLTFETHLTGLNHLTVAAAALHTTSSWDPVPPEQPIAPI